MSRIKLGDRIRITYHKDGKIRRPTILVIYARGPDIIGVDKNTGTFYATWWQSRTKDNSPKKRRDKQWRITERSWRKFPQGLNSILRGIQQAMMAAKNVRIPDLEEVQAFCKEIAGELVILKECLAGNESVFRREFAIIGEAVAKATSPELKEVKTQISFCILFRDKLGRINVGVILARLVAVENRLWERIKNIFGWLPHYAARVQALENFRRRQQTLMRNLRNTIKAMEAHTAWRNNQATASQAKGMATALRRHLPGLQEARTIQPFVLWAGLCHNDLVQAAALIERQNFKEAEIILNRVFEAIKCKELQLDIDNLITQIEVELPSLRSNFSTQSTDFKNRHGSQIEIFLQRLESIDETGFRFAVKVIVGAYLTQALNQLPSYIGPNKESLEMVLESLKAASAAL